MEFGLRVKLLSGFGVAKESEMLDIPWLENVVLSFPEMEKEVSSILAAEAKRSRGRKKEIVEKAANRMKAISMLKILSEEF